MSQGKKGRPFGHVSRARHHSSGCLFVQRATHGKEDLVARPKRFHSSFAFETEGFQALLARVSTPPLIVMGRSYRASTGLCCCALTCRTAQKRGFERHVQCPPSSSRYEKQLAVLIMKRRFMQIWRAKLPVSECAVGERRLLGVFFLGVYTCVLCVSQPSTLCHNTVCMLSNFAQMDSSKKRDMSWLWYKVAVMEDLLLTY